MPDSIEVSDTVPASARQVYEAWLDSAEHSSFTGAAALIDPRVGGEHTAWDGYIRGTTIILEPYTRIVQTWRTTDFPADSPDSRLEVRLAEVEGGTRLTLVHTAIPDGQGPEYEQGWRDWYFAPLRRYFGADQAPTGGRLP